MASAFAQSVSKLPKGCRATPLNPDDRGSPLRAALVVQNDPATGSGPFIRLRDMTCGTVFLGCIEDAGGRVLRWLEVWVQHAENLDVTRQGYKEALCNHLLDERWKGIAHDFAKLDPEAFIQTGWEEVAPRPLFFDRESGDLFHPGNDESGANWELCTDDARLVAEGLPPYSTTLVRYLVASEGERDRFVPISAGAPDTERTTTLSEILTGAVPFNPGGLMMLRILAPLGLEEWLDILSGSPWDGIPGGRRPVALGGVYGTLSDAGEMRHGLGHLLLGARGLGGRLLEAYHLKMQSIASAFRLVKKAVETVQLPMLNIRAESFNVRLRSLDSGLPILWAGQTTLAVPGDAVALPVETTEARYFVPSDFGETSIYRPAEAGVPVKGTGQLRIRKVLPEAGETTRIEASLVTQERLAASPADLLWINAPLPGGHVRLYGHIEMNGSEVRFQSVPQKLEDAEVSALRKAEGAPMANVLFELVPMLSSPCDLYALGVLAVRALFVDAANSLPVALDEIHSLARAADSGGEGDTDTLVDRVTALFEGDSRWNEALGPHRLVWEEIVPNDALAAFPPPLWCGTLAWIIRLFPGVVPESYCRDHADAPSPALEAVFTKPIDELARLLEVSRSTMVSDVHAHREIRAVIDSFLTPS